MLAQTAMLSNQIFKFIFLGINGIFPPCDR